MQLEHSEEEESFIPDIIPPEIKEATQEPEKPAEVRVATRTAAPPVIPTSKPVKAVTTTSTFWVHHAIIGLGIMGASMLVFLVPTLKPITKVAVAGLGATLGAVLVYDDLVQHWEGNCDVANIFNFTPCPGEGKVTVVKRQ